MAFESKPLNIEQLKAKLLRELFEVGAVTRGEFILKSGLKSNIYYDLRIALTNPKTRILIEKLLLLTIPRDTDYIILSGLAGEILTAIIPRITSTPFCWVSKREMDDIPESLNGYAVPDFFKHFRFSGFNCVSNRSNWIVPTSKTKILLIDDVLTGGSARREGNELLAKYFPGAEISSTHVIVDRSNGDSDVTSIIKSNELEN